GVGAVSLETSFQIAWFDQVGRGFACLPMGQRSADGTTKRCTGWVKRREEGGGGGRRRRRRRRRRGRKGRRSPSEQPSTPGSGSRALGPAGRTRDTNPAEVWVTPAWKSLYTRLS
ncbi:unnamed protein product, partial [Prorocentrum cordatum]